MDKSARRSTPTPRGVNKDALVDQIIEDAVERSKGAEMSSEDDSKGVYEDDEVDAAPMALSTGEAPWSLTSWVRGHAVITCLLLIASLSTAIVLAASVTSCVLTRRKQARYAPTKTTVVESGSTERLHVPDAPGEQTDVAFLQTNGFENPTYKLFEQQEIPDEHWGPDMRTIGE